MSKAKKQVDEGKIRESYYLRDFWGVQDGRERWARRGAEHATEAEAMKEAKTLAKQIGKGSRVQVVHVLSVVAGEVKG